MKIFPRYRLAHTLCINLPSLWSSLNSRPLCAAFGCFLHAALSHYCSECYGCRRNNNSSIWQQWPFSFLVLLQPTAWTSQQQTLLRSGWLEPLVIIFRAVPLVCFWLLCLIRDHIRLQFPAESYHTCVILTHAHVSYWSGLITALSSVLVKITGSGWSPFMNVWMTVVWVPGQLSRLEQCCSAMVTLMLHAKYCIHPCSEINVLLLMVFLGSSVFCTRKR